MDRYFIYRRRWTGLGDLLIGVYYCWRYCKKYKMDLIIDWTDSAYLEDDVNVYSIFFKDCKINGVKILSSNTIDFPEPIYASSEKVSEFMKFKRNIFDLKGIEANTIISGSGVSLVFSRDENNELIKKEKINFYGELTSHLKEEIVEIVNIKKNIIFTDNKKYVGIQIRNGNGVEAYHNYGRRNLYLQDVEKLVLEIVNIINFIYKKYEVFLSTDSKNIKDLFIEKLPRIKTLEIWYPEHGKENQYAKEGGCPDPKAAMIDAFVDMKLLSYCDIIYRVGNLKSCFPVMASYLNKETKLMDIGIHS
jgi:hypothetical protein